MKLLTWFFHVLSFGPLFVPLAGIYCAMRRQRLRPSTCGWVVLGCGALLAGRLVIPPVAAFLSGLLPSVSVSGDRYTELKASILSAAYGLPYTVGVALLLWCVFAPREPYP